MMLLKKYVVKNNIYDLALAENWLKKKSRRKALVGIKKFSPLFYCINIIFSSAEDLTIDSGILPSLFPRCYYQIFLQK